MTIFQRPEGFPEPEPIGGPSTKLEYIDPEDVENEDYGEVLGIEDGIAAVH